MQSPFVVYALLAYSATFFIILFFFSLYHLELVVGGKTTNEAIRGKYTKYKGNPYDKGCRKNCSDFFGYHPSKIFDNKIQNEHN